jgi:membrane dipeptidase
MSSTRRDFVAALAALGLPRWIRQPNRLVVDGLDTSAINDEFLGLVRQGGVHCVHKTLFQEATFRDFHAFAAARTDSVVVATTVAEIRAARAANRIAFVLGCQAASGMYGNGIGEAMAEAPLGSLALIRPALEQRHRLGLRVQGLCYNVSDVFGSGCLEPTGPLSRAGRRLVEEIHQAKVVLDVGGHTGERTSVDAIAMSSSVPVVCSHTNFAALNPNRRCISNRLAEAIARTGGLIGLTAVSDFLVRNATVARTHGPTSPQAKLDVLLDQFDHGRRLVGAEHLAIGPDFRWGQGTAPVDPTDTVTFTPDELSAGPLRDVLGFEHIGELPNLVAGLEKRGWRQAELDNVLGANWLRVWHRVWGG